MDDLWLAITSHDVEMMIHLVNKIVRSELMMAVIHTDEPTEPLKRAKQSAQDLNYWLHELKKELASMA